MLQVSGNVASGMLFLQWFEDVNVIFGLNYQDYLDILCGLYCESNLSL